MENEHYILDTSFIESSRQSLTEKLYDSTNGLESVDLAQIERGLESRIF